jgi:DNA-binding response OmpR family regulator
MTIPLLIADDDPTIRLLAQAALHGKGFDVTAVADGGAAQEALRDKHFSMLLLDVEMPVLDGYLVCTAARRQFPELPIVLLTGHDDRDSIATAFDSGATDLIAKPVDWTRLAEKLLAILEKHGKTPKSCGQP